MPKVPFIYAKFDVNYPDHPKIAGLSDAAFRAHVEMILHSRRFLTDGRIANRFANRFGSEVITELETNDESNPSLVRLEDGDYQLHDFVTIQGTRDDAESRSQVNRANGRRGGRPPRTESVSERKPKPEGSQSQSQSQLEEAKASSLPRKRGARLPDDWKPSDGDREYATTRGIDPIAEAENFRDYWHNKPGKDGVKLDWSLAWKTWVRKSAERRPSLAAVPNKPWMPTPGSPLSYVEM